MIQIRSLTRMLESLKPRAGKRWPRGQKFGLSQRGLEAECAYREAVAAARASGRGALETAERNWAVPLGIQPNDGVVLGELRGGRRSIADLARELESCGVSATDVKAIVDRLCEAQLVEPQPATSEAAA
jgi:hypothetical protein